MSERGWAIGAEWQDRGTELTTAVSAGATTLHVEWTGLFDSDGGVLDLNGERLAYTTADDEEANTSTITLAVGPIAGAAVDDRVLSVDGGQIETRYVLKVDQGEGDPIEVEIPYEQRDMWPEGDYDDPVHVLLSDSLEKIDEVPNRTPRRDPTFVEPGSAPWVPDGVPPATASTVTPQPVPGALAYRWTEVPNADPVTYRLHVRAGSAPTTDGTYEVASGVAVTAALVRKLADGTVVDSTGAVTYYAIVSVEDADGRGPDSSAVTSAPAQVQSGELAIDAVTTTHLTARDAFIGAAQGVDWSTVTFTSPSIQTEVTENRGIKLGYDPDGGAYLRAWSSAGGSPFFDVTPNKGLVIVAGEATLEQATTKAATLGGATDIGAAGTLTLRSGATAPTNKPTVGSTYDSVTFTQDGDWGSRRGWAWDGTYYYTANQATRRVEKWNTSGALVASSSQWSGTQFTPTSAVVGGGVLWVGMMDTVNPNFYLFAYSPSTLAFTTLAWFPDYNVGGKLPAVGYDSTSGASNPLTVAQARTSGTVRVHRGAIVSGDFVTGSTLDTFTIDVNLSSVLYAQDVAGVGGFDFAAGGPSRYLFTSHTGPSAAVANGSTGAERTTDEFALGITDKVGVVWNGAAFLSMDRSGVLRTYTTLDKEVTQTNASTTKWVSDAFYRSTGPWETGQSPKAKVVQFPKRSKMTVTGPALPASPGANDPNQIQIYIGSGSTEPADSAMWRQTTPSTGVNTTTYSALTTSGSAHPNAGTVFPSSGPASFRSDGLASDAAPLTRLDSDGTGRALKIMQGGAVNTGTVTANVAASQTVTFLQPFDATPSVKAWVHGIPDTFSAWETSVTTTGFTINYRRVTGTTAFDVQWRATAKTQ